MKKCTFCAEEILDDAIKCKHCGEWIKNEHKHAQASTFEIEGPDSKWWYRLLKVLYIVSFFAITITWLSFGYSETKGDLEEFLFPAIFSLVVISLFFSLIQRLFHYVAWGKVSRSVPKNTAGWSTDKTINKVVLVLFPIISVFTGLFSLVDEGEYRFAVSLVYFIFAYIGINSLLKRRAENRTWFLRGRWVMWLAWAVSTMFIFGLILIIYFLLIRPLFF
jgi:hypothetical protein